MKAAVLERLNAPLAIADIVVPEKLDVGQVLVKVEASTICGAQIGEVTGAKGDDPYLPHLLGHEGCGTVMAIGPGVRHVGQGDRVVMHWRKGIGIDAPFPKYKWHDKTVGGGSVTTFAELAVISENRLTPVAKSVPAKVASLFGCAVTTALGLINNEAQLKIGQSIAVAGCGGVGLNIIQGAAMVSANPIIAIDRNRSQLQLAAQLGATHAIDGTTPIVAEQIHRVVGSRGVDVFVECTGNCLMINDGYTAVAPNGIMVLVGQPSITADVVLHNMRQHYVGKSLIDSQGGLTNPTVDIPRYAALYADGRLKLDLFITQTIALEGINAAINQLRMGQAVGRIAIEMP